MSGSPISKTKIRMRSLIIGLIKFLLILFGIALISKDPSVNGNANSVFSSYFAVFALLLFENGIKTFKENVYEMLLGIFGFLHCLLIVAVSIFGLSNIISIQSIEGISYLVDGEGYNIMILGNIVLETFFKYSILTTACFYFLDLLSPFASSFRSPKFFGYKTIIKEDG